MLCYEGIQFFKFVLIVKLMTWFDFFSIAIQIQISLKSDIISTPVLGEAQIKLTKNQRFNNIARIIDFKTAFPSGKCLYFFFFW